MVKLEYALKTQQVTHLVGHLWLAGGRRDHDYLPMCCAGFLLITPYDRATQASDSSSEEDETLVIPQTADVYFDVVDGTPGLQIETRNTSRWTLIACRTRSKSKQCS